MKKNREVMKVIPGTGKKQLAFEGIMFTALLMVYSLRMDVIRVKVR
jgi:hypothetical protein